MKKTYVSSIIALCVLTLVGNLDANIYRNENPDRVRSSNPVSTGYGRDRRRMANRTYKYWPDGSDRWNNRRWWDTEGYDQNNSYYYNCRGGSCR